MIVFDRGAIRFLEWRGTAEFKTKDIPIDWIRPDLNDPVNYIGVPVDWIRQKILGCGFSRLCHFLATWIPDAVDCIILFSTFN
jgi:hypothetical protein